MRKIIFAGVGSIYGVNEIKDYFINNTDIDVEFIENEVMSKYLDEASKQCTTITNTLYSTENSIVIPLNEYWLSKVISTDAINNISQKALLASRSKKFLSDILQTHNIEFVNYYSKNQALEEIKKGHTIVIKPDSLYSGHGLSFVCLNNVDRLDDNIKKASIAKEDTLHVLNLKEVKPMLFEYIQGDEYSADVLFWQGNIILVTGQTHKKYL